MSIANLAVLWRQLQKITWVAVTGSCGKTSVKEMISAILSSEGSCISTLGNQNNQLGVPLTLLRARVEDKFGVAELGADHQGEIKKTVAWVQPKVALINNVNPAHLDGFGSLEGIAAAKSEIFLRSGLEMLLFSIEMMFFLNFGGKEFQTGPTSNKKRSLKSSPLVSTQMQILDYYPIRQAPLLNLTYKFTVKIKP